MFFAKKKIIKQTEDAKLSYYMHRDSLTGQMDKSFAVEEFEKLKGQEGFGAVLVRLSAADSMYLYEAEDKIKRTSRLLVNITDEEISRIEYGDFLIFTKDCELLADKIFGFLKEFSDEGLHYGVGAKRFDEHEKDFDDFLKRIAGCATLSQIAKVNRAVY